MTDAERLAAVRECVTKWSGHMKRPAQFMLWGIISAELLDILDGVKREDAPDPVDITPALPEPAKRNES